MEDEFSVREKDGNHAHTENREGYRKYTYNGEIHHRLVKYTTELPQKPYKFIRMVIYTKDDHSMVL